MSKLRVHTFGISLDGYGAGPNREATVVVPLLLVTHGLMFWVLLRSKQLLHTASTLTP
jgi:hypothetical protein